MKRTLALMIALLLLSFTLLSCQSKPKTTPTCEEVIAAYKEAGYHVSHFKNPNSEIGLNCYIEVYDDDMEDESAYIYFYDSAESAEAHELDWNVLLYLYSVIYGDPTWVHTGTYDSIAYEYEHTYMMQPFKDLID